VYTSFNLLRPKATVSSASSDGTHHGGLIMKEYKAIARDLSERIVIVGGGFAGVTVAQPLEHSPPLQTKIIVLGASNQMDHG
jgi:hypothetical protein